MTLVSWFVLLNQHDQCIQIHKQSSSNEKSFTEWIDQNQVMWQPHTHICIYMRIYVCENTCAVAHTWEISLAFLAFLTNVPFFPNPNPGGAIRQIPLLSPNAGGAKRPILQQQAGHRSGNRWLCHAWAFSGRSNKTAQQWTTLREKTEKGHI